MKNVARERNVLEHMLITWLHLRLICDSEGSDVFVYPLQTCFVDCLIEQTHPEIRKRDDVDVSCLLK